MLAGLLYGLIGGSLSKFNSYTCMHRRAFLARLAALVQAGSLSFALVFIIRKHIVSLHHIVYSPSQ